MVPLVLAVDAASAASAVVAAAFLVLVGVGVSCCRLSDHQFRDHQRTSEEIEWKEPALDVSLL